MKTFLHLIIGIAVCIGAAFLLRINPEAEYGWFMGAVHGLLLVPNWLISLFDSSWLIKAPLHTRIYNIDWWVCGILDIAYWIWAIIGAVISIVRSR